MLAVLLDPEKATSVDVPHLCEYIRNDTVDFIFVGGSTGSQSTDNLVNALKKQIPTLPIILFPGSIQQFTPKADALLFLSLLSGRNPDMLIGNQVRAAKNVRESGIETISMGYILVDGGKESAVERASKTRAISVDKTDEIVSTALAAELLGMQTVYLEAGSGALHPIEVETIRQVRDTIHLPLIVGGGICTLEQMKVAFQAGADIVVIGNHFEQHPEEIPLFGSLKLTL